MRIAPALLRRNSYSFLIPILGSCALLISCVLVSQKKYFWIDELFSFYLLNDPDFLHMMTALSDKINNAPPLYFILGWLWARVFSASELSLRLFSSLAICAAMIIVWLTLRRIYDFGSASLATLTAFCTSNFILTQNAEARFYGLFIAVCSLGLFLFSRLCRTEQIPMGLMVTNIFIHILIIQTHLYGFFYSGAILAALIIGDKYFNRFRPILYLSIILAWLSFIPWIPAFLIQADLGKPYSWIPVPSWNDLLDLYFNLFPIFIFKRKLSYLFQLILLGTGIILIIQAKTKLKKNNNIVNSNDLSLERSQDLVEEISVIILALMWLMIPLLSWLISHLLKPLFVDRYMIPAQMSWLILLAAFIYRIFSANFQCNILKLQRVLPRKFLIYLNLVIPLILIGFILVNPVYYAQKYPINKRPGLQDNKYAYENLPIALEDIHAFLPKFYYSQKPSRYYFMLDWEVAIDKGSGLSSPGDYKAMDALKRNYPDIFAKNVVKTQDFLIKNKSFLALYSQSRCSVTRKIFCYKWLEKRINNNPLYKIKKLGKIKNNDLLIIQSTE